MVRCVCVCVCACVCVMREYEKGASRARRGESGDWKQSEGKRKTRRPSLRRRLGASGNPPSPVWPQKRPHMPPPPCRLLAGKAALLAQLALAAVCVAALLAKRAREPPPRRPPRVFAADVSKQALAAAAAHGVGLTIAVAAASATAHASSECGFYLCVFVLDTALGSALSVALHTACVRAAAAAVAAGRAGRAVTSIARCGEYGDPLLPSLLPQLAEWTLCVLIARAVCACIAAVSLPALTVAAAGVDTVLAPLGPSGELFIVMLLGPITLNVIQALIQDAALKHRRGGERARGEGGVVLPGAEERGGLLPATAAPS